MKTPIAQTTTAYISMGSNMGDCVGQLAKAVDALMQTEGITVEALSPLYWTEPQGTIPVCTQKDIQNISSTHITSPQNISHMSWFANKAACLTCSEIWTSALLMTQLLHIENIIGRQRTKETVRNAPRIIDLDLLLFGEEKNTSAHCTLPHPRMTQRAFMLIPLRDVLSRDILHTYLLEQNGQERTLTQCLETLTYTICGDKIYQPAK